MDIPASRTSHPEGIRTRSDEASGRVSLCSPPIPTLLCIAREETSLTPPFALRPRGSEHPRSVPLQHSLALHRFLTLYIEVEQTIKEKKSVFKDLLDIGWLLRQLLEMLK